MQTLSAFDQIKCVCKRFLSLFRHHSIHDCDLSDCFYPLTTRILKRTAEAALPFPTSIFVLAVHDYHCTFPRRYTKPHETTTKPVTKPLVFYRQNYETTFLKKKRFIGLSYQYRCFLPFLACKCLQELSSF